MLGRKSKTEPTAGRQSRSGTDNRVPYAQYYRASAKPAAPVVAPTGPSLWRRLLNVGLAVVILFCLAYSLILRPQPVLSVDSEQFHTKAQYAATASDLMGGLGSRTKLTFDSSKFVSNMMQQYPEVKAVEVTVPPLGQRPKVELQISQPSLQIKSAGQLYTVDDRGRVIGGQDSYPDLPLVQDDSGFKIQVGKSALSGDQVAFITTIVKQLQAKGIPIQSLTLPPKAEELFLKTADKPYYVKFLTNGNALQQVGTYLATRQHLDETGQTPSEYIDVRVEGRVFYK